MELTFRAACSDGFDRAKWVREREGSERKGMGKAMAAAECACGGANRIRRIGGCSVVSLCSIVFYYGFPTVET